MTAGAVGAAGARRLPPLAAIVGGRPDGPWVTFVPGIGNDASFWADQADALASGFGVLRFEPWGCGDSADPPDDLTIDDVADGVVALWDALGLRTSSVVGLGFGGSVALDVALRHPDRVERVVACCCRARQPDDRRGFWRGRQARAEAEGLGTLADDTVDRWLSPEFRASNPARA